MLIYGRNVVRELLRSNKQARAIFALDGLKNIDDIMAEAQKRKIEVRRVDRQTLDKNTGTEKHQGIAVEVEDAKPESIDEFLQAAKGMDAATIAVLDEVEDPHNLGAVIRSAEVFGIDAVMIQDKRSSPISATVYKASSGAVEYVKIVQVVNISRALQLLKEDGFWVFGFDASGQKFLDEVEFDRKTALVFGNEGRGMRQLVKRQCDFLVKIRQKGRVASLNVSNAAAIAFYSRMTG